MVAEVPELGKFVCILSVDRRDAMDSAALVRIDELLGHITCDSLIRE